MFALMVTAQVVPLVDTQPVHDEKELPPAVEGAVKVTAVPEMYVSVKLAVPLVVRLLSAGKVPMVTAVLEGFKEFTVNV